MTGIFLLSLVIGWFCIAVWLSILGARRIEVRRFRLLFGIFFFATLMVLPFADEVIGGYQFREICSEEAIIKIDKKKAMGKTVRLEVLDGKSRGGTYVPVREQAWQYVDVETGEVVVSYKTLHARGGWLIHMLKISETDSPLTFNKTCGPKEIHSLFKNLDIQVVYQ